MINLSIDHTTPTENRTLINEYRFVLSDSVLGEGRALVLAGIVAY